MPRHLQEAFEEFYRLTGRRYDFVDGYRLDDAEYAIVGLGTVMETARPAIDWMRAKFGWKVGLLHVTSFRPFPAREIVAALKKNEIHLHNDQIRLEGVLKELGLYTVKFRLSSEVEGELKVWVVPQVGADA